MRLYKNPSTNQSIFDIRTTLNPKLKSCGLRAKCLRFYTSAAASVGLKSLCAHPQNHSEKGNTHANLNGRSGRFRRTNKRLCTTRLLALVRPKNYKGSQFTLGPPQRTPTRGAYHKTHRTTPGSPNPTDLILKYVFRNKVSHRTPQSNHSPTDLITR